MKKRNTTKGLLVSLVLAVTTFSLVGIVPSANLASAQSALGSVEADINSPEVKSLAQDRRISKPEARKRITWQNKATNLDKQLRKDLPNDRFGGVWIDENTDRVKVGVVGGLAPTDAQKKNVDDKVSGNALVEATDVVPVKYSYAQLDEAMNWITGQLTEGNQNAEWPLSLELNPDKNKLTLTLPLSDSQLTKQQNTLLEKARKRYGDMIATAKSSNKIRTEACNDRYCDAPLRGGVGIHGVQNGDSCTAGFIVKGSSGHKYVLTAGHCSKHGDSTWYTRNSSNKTKTIGNVKNKGLYRNGGYDAMTIDIVDGTGWTANGTIYMRKGLDLWGWDGPSRNEQYNIEDMGTNGALTGQRVCKSGAYFGASCGPIIASDVTISVTYSSSTAYTIKKVVRAQYCSRPGDSGAPIVRTHSALGMHIASANSDDCSSTKYYAAIGSVLRAFKEEYNQTYSVF